MNAHSSRSHLVVSLEAQATSVTGDGGGQLTSIEDSFSARLQLVDLAGSERLAKTDATGDRLKEAQHINKSLSALGDVIAALGSAQQAKSSGKAATAAPHVPYRNSKLTFLLMDALAGGSKVLMFVNASPATYNASETHCSLTFAARCRNVALGQAKRSADPAEVSRLRREISSLQSQLQAAGITPLAETTTAEPEEVADEPSRPRRLSSESQSPAAQPAGPGRGASRPGLQKTISRPGANARRLSM